MTDFAVGARRVDYVAKTGRRTIATASNSFLHDGGARTGRTACDKELVRWRYHQRPEGHLRMRVAWRWRERVRCDAEFAARVSIALDGVPLMVRETANS